MNWNGSVVLLTESHNTGSQIYQIPVLFGGGPRLFDVLPSHIELEIVRVIDTPDATHSRYRVRR
jgi:hypothetical protein